MKKLLAIIVLGLLFSGSAIADVVAGLKCGSSIITVDKKFIYQIFASGDIDKYKITQKGINYFAGTFKSESTIYEVFLDVKAQKFSVNSKDRKTGIVGGYERDCL